MEQEWDLSQFTWDELLLHAAPVAGSMDLPWAAG